MVPVGQQGADYREPLPADSDAEGADPGPGAEGLAPEIRSAQVSAAQHGQRLDKLLVLLAPEFSRSRLQQLIEGGHVRLDGTLAISAARPVRAGQRVQLELVPTEESQAFRPQPMALAVLHEDAHLLVIDKPAGLVVHPAPGNWSGTLLNGLLAHHAAAATLPRAGIVHRLDKDTSGVMMVGKSLAAVTALTRAIAARQVHRRYLALAHGVPAMAGFVIDAPIGRDPVARVRMAVMAGGRPSRTDVQCLGAMAGAPAGAAGGESARSNAGAGAGAGAGADPSKRASAAGRDAVSALSCTLHSGRTHQIRVHLASRGHPLVADALYGGRPLLGLQRQALHATELRLAHPIDGQALAFDCPPPADLAFAWAQVMSGPDAR